MYCPANLPGLLIDTHRNDVHALARDADLGQTLGDPTTHGYASARRCADPTAEPADGPEALGQR